MSMRDPEVNLLRKSFLFCMCVIVVGVISPYSRASAKNHAVRHSVQSHAGALLPPAYGDLAARFIENRKQAGGKAAIHGVWFYEADIFIHRRIAPSLEKAEGKIGRIRPESANPEVIPAARRARKLSEGHASYLRVRLLGINGKMEVAPGDAPAVKLNCFTADAPGKGPANIPTCKALLYRKTTPRTDSKTCGKNSQFERDSVAKPGAAPAGQGFKVQGHNTFALPGPRKWRRPTERTVQSSA